MREHESWVTHCTFDIHNILHIYTNFEEKKRRNSMFILLYKGHTIYWNDPDSRDCSYKYFFFLIFKKEKIEQ